MITIRLDSPVPLGEQVLLSLREAIATGQVVPGDELPPVRQLAADLGINLNTVARAYRELEREGLVSSVRGRGTRVTSASESPRRSRAQAREPVIEGLRQALADARLAGLDRAAVEALFARMVPDFWPDA